MSTSNAPEARQTKRKKRGRPTSAARAEAAAAPDYFFSTSIAHTVGFGITEPPPQHSRVQVKSFARVSQIIDREIRSHLALCTDDFTDIDLDVSDLRYKPPDVEVTEAINRASERPEFGEMGSEEFTTLAQIPVFEELVQQEKNSSLIAAKHIKFVRAAITKVRNKHVNYLSKNATVEDKREIELIDGSEVLLTVALYPPQSTSLIQEFLVLSTQPLSALKDVLYCLQDQAPMDLTSDDTPRTLNPSGFFFIDDTFYVDSRRPDNVDYAEPVINWMKSGASPYWSTQTVKKAVMQDTKFLDLNIQIGKRYLYCHRAKCEHILIFTDIRQLKASDDPNVHAYPKQLFQARYRQRRCTICDRALAKWITSEDSFSIEDPAYYCSDCFDMAHKSEDGTINQTGFKLLPYLHD